MSLAAGTRIGSYEIVSTLGAGGMGEVYRARDVKLGREVALKILPEALANDPERVARFDREARTLASLNHPHIAHLHGFEEQGSIRALVMELVEGEDLAGRIARGPIAIDEALPIARQIAQALEAAHEHGIVHRDLKPSNIKVRPDATVKVLDFGLAKALEPDRDPASGAPLNSPTITTPAMTLRGVVLGTAAYMAPEQAKGSRVDKRADIWAFGCVLYEMLTARRAFDGDDTSETLASILKTDPDWHALPPSTPHAIRKLLQRCLTKDRARRLADIADARLEIDDAIGGGTTESAPRMAGATSWRRIAILLVATAAIFGLAGSYLTRRLTPLPASTPKRLSIALPPGQLFKSLGSSIAISADGSLVVYTSLDGLYARPLNSFSSRLIPGTSGNVGALSPSISPDRQFVAFFAADEGLLKTVPLDGGPAATLDAMTAATSGIIPTFSWDSHGLIAAQGRAGIARLSPRGGHKEVLVRAADGEAMVSPQMLPDGDHVLYTLLSGATISRGLYASTRIVAQSLKTGARTTIIDNGTDGRYISTGHLVYVSHGFLFAAPFSLRDLRVTGRSVPMVDGVRIASVVTATAQYSVSDSGTLVYLTGPTAPTQAALVQLGYVDRNGGVEPFTQPPGPYEALRVSPDGARVAFSSDDGNEASVWIYDLAGANAMRRLTLGGRNRFPVWSPDSQRVAYQSDRDGDVAIFAQRADGTSAAERLTKPEAGSWHVPESWSPSGSHLLFSESKNRQFTLETLSLSTKTVEPFGGVSSTAPTAAAFSPDGRWVAYGTMTEDRPTSVVYVQPFPASGAIYQISKGDDGHHPVWSRDGSELSYVPGPGRLVAVKIATKPGFSISAPIPLAPAGLQGPPNIQRNHDIAKDGRFVALIPADDVAGGGPPRLHVVLNWTEELKGIQQ